MTFDLGFFLDFTFKPSGALLDGLVVTVVASVAAMTLGLLLGVLLAVGALTRLWPVRALCRIYVIFFRGTPLLVQIFLVYFGTPYLFGFDLFPTDVALPVGQISGALLAGIIAMSLGEAAYASEIVRAGIKAVPRGQREAAFTLGMSSRQGMWHIVLPQAMRIVIPPLGNDFNNILKLSSLMSVIGVTDLFRIAQGVNAATFKSFEVFLGISVYYVALTALASSVQNYLESRARTESAPTSWRSRIRQRKLGSGLSHA